MTADEDTDFGGQPGRAAWEAISAHLRAEAAWRASRNVEPIRRYETWECLGGYTLRTEFSCWEAMTNAEGAVYGQMMVGDVFEQAEAMIEGGWRVLSSLRQQLADSGHHSGTIRSEDGGSRDGQRDGCWVRLDLEPWLDIQMPDEVEEAPGPAFADDKESGGEKGDEKYLRHVLESVMAASRVEKHEEGGEGDTHDYDLVAPDGQIEARVECTVLTVEAPESLSARSWEPKQRKGGQQPRFRWEARLVISDPAAWQSLDGDRTALKHRYGLIENRLLERVLWAEEQMGTPKGAANLAGDRSQPHGTGWRLGEDTGAKAHFSAEEPPPGEHGSLLVRADGSSTGWAGLPYGPESSAAARINGAVAKKADKNQAGAHPEPKWLIVSLSGLWTVAETSELDGRLEDPDNLAAFAAEIDLRGFDEVWIVWETAHSDDQVTAVVVLAAGGPPRCFLVRTDWQRR